MFPGRFPNIPDSMWNFGWNPQTVGLQGPTQRAAASTASAENPVRHQSPPSAVSATPATWNECGCDQVPRLPRKELRRPRRQLRTRCATRARPVPLVPRLPCETNVDVTKCQMSPSAKPAMQRAAASTASAENPVRHQSPPTAVSATPATWNECGCDQVPRLPRKVKVDVTKCHICHAKSRGVHGVSWEPGAPPEPAHCRKCHACHVKRMWMWPSATPATWNEGGCRQVACEQVVWWQAVCVRKCVSWVVCVCEQVVWWQVVCVICERVVCVSWVVCEQVVWVELSVSKLCVSWVVCELCDDKL